MTLFVVLLQFSDGSKIKHLSRQRDESDLMAKIARAYPRREIEVLSVRHIHQKQIQLRGRIDVENS